VTAGPAAACTYPVPVSEAKNAARADAVFVGTVVSRFNHIDWAARAVRAELTRELWTRPYRVDRVRELMRKAARSSDRAVLTFEVGRVYKGPVGERPEIVSPEPPSGCERRFPGPGPVVVFANKPSQDMSRRYQLEPGQYVWGSGSRALADGGEPDLGGSGELDQLVTAVTVGVLAAVVMVGLATLKARRRAD
jgi:hypothetical protein